LATKVIIIFESYKFIMVHMAKKLQIAHFTSPFPRNIATNIWLLQINVVFLPSKDILLAKNDSSNIMRGSTRYAGNLNSYKLWDVL